MTRALGRDSLRSLGRSALKVSPLALGTATFGLKWGRGMDVAGARRISPDGNAEHFVGQVAAGKRDRLVIAAPVIGVRALQQLEDDLGLRLDARGG